MSRDCASASAFTRALTTARSTVTSPSAGAPDRSRTPSGSLQANVVIDSLVAISVFDGTQSASTQAPPSPSRSTTSTSAPSWAPTSAAS